MTVRFIELAESELDRAIERYRAQARGLGDVFLTEVLEAVRRIERFPEAWHPLGNGIRRCRLRRFPYALIYVVKAGDVIILAVAHVHRRPDYWRERIG